MQGEDFRDADILTHHPDMPAQFGREHFAEKELPVQRFHFVIVRFGGKGTDVVAPDVEHGGTVGFKLDQAHRNTSQLTNDAGTVDHPQRIHPSLGMRREGKQEQNSGNDMYAGQD